MKLDRERIGGALNGSPLASVGGISRGQRSASVAYLDFELHFTSTPSHFLS